MLYKKCYECNVWIDNDSVDEEDKADDYHVVRYPAQKISSKGAMVFPDGEVDVYLCDECFEENKEKVVKEYG